MPRLPRIGATQNADPHVVIIGAGGSRAACPAGDRNGLALPVMADLMDTIGLRLLIQRGGLVPDAGNFEAVYDHLARSEKNSGLILEIENKIREYFTQLQLPDTATVYDYLLLSLRPKDLIATFNWDPLLAQAFRRHEGLIAMPQLAFLHGNVAVGFCDEHRAFGWHDDRCRVCGQPFAPSPLLFPVRDKAYTARPSIRSQWALLEQFLEDAYFVTIFGYSAPVTDAPAREALFRVWSRNQTREIAEIEILDIRPPKELQETWKDFIVRSHYITGASVREAYTSWHPRRSCDALFAATMMNSPWKDDWLPDFTDPVKLREWVDPLWREEIRLSSRAEKFSGRPCCEWHNQS